MKNLSTGNPSGRFSLKSKIFCILFGIFLVLAGLELYLRLLGLGYNLIHQAPVDTGADYRIYCVGESTTWGVGASDPILKGYPRQLEEMLNEKYKGMKIQCFFDQAIGQNTSEILGKLSQSIEKYRPQLIIFLVGANNWWNMDRSNILLFNKYSAVSRPVLKVLIFLDRFRVWKLFKNAAFSAGFFRERWDYWFPKGTAVTEMGKKIVSETDLQIFDLLAEHDIEEMVKMGRFHGIRMIMCTYPMYPGDLRRVQRNMAKKFGMPLVDLYEVFQKLKDQRAYLWPEDHWHPNDAGYAVVAENIYNCILENGLIETGAKKDPP